MRASTRIVAKPVRIGARGANNALLEFDRQVFCCFSDCAASVSGIANELHKDVTALDPLRHIRASNAHTPGLEVAILASQDDESVVSVGPGSGAVKVLNLFHF